MWTESWEDPPVLHRTLHRMSGARYGFVDVGLIRKQKKKLFLKADYGGVIVV